MKLVFACKPSNPGTFASRYLPLANHPLAILTYYYDLYPLHSLPSYLSPPGYLPRTIYIPFFIHLQLNATRHKYNKQDLRFKGWIALIMDARCIANSLIFFLQISSFFTFVKTSVVVAPVDDICTRILLRYILKDIFS